MILIASGAYVIPEFQVELGKIPPCLLPIANKKLIELQVKALQETFHDDVIFLTLPESYELSSYESKLFDSLNVNIIKIPDAFKLCDSLLYVLNTHESLVHSETLYLLHGDTYISDFSNLSNADLLSISKSSESYNWEVVSQNLDHTLVWSGFFSFGSIKYLLKSLTLNRDNYVDAVKYYAKQHSLKAVEISQWYDLGHANTYFNSRANITTQRAFNDLKIENGVVRKKGSPSIKIQAEALWFDNVPTSIKKYIPVLVQHGNETKNSYFYELEYLPYIPLNELYVHGKNEVLQWNGIFDQLSDFLNICSENQCNEILQNDINQDSYKLFVDKTKIRFEEYAQVADLSLDHEFVYKNVKLPSMIKILDDCINKSLNSKIIHGVMHGDLCFSNILFDSRGNRIKVIDPRGINFKNEFTIYGDTKYDFAKLAHSVIGLYDYIISGYYVIEESANGSLQIVFDVDKRIESIQKHFIKHFKVQDLAVKDIMPLVVLLFLSMLPLHSDRQDRQKAMLINALRLYKDFIYKG
jgi:hypothetical protein